MTMQWSLKRPDKIDDVVVGNPEILGEAKSLAKEGQCVLISGETGTGKTTLARAMALELNGNLTSYIEQPAESQGIDDVRAIRNRIKYAPDGKKWVVMLDEVHGYSGAAFKALLTLVETPPNPNVLFLLCTDQPHSLPTTLRGRCRKLIIKKPDFKQALPLLSRMVKSSKAELTKTERIALIKKYFQLNDSRLREVLQDLQSACDQINKGVSVKAILGTEGKTVKGKDSKPDNVETQAGSLLLALTACTQGQLEEALKFIIPLPSNGSGLAIVQRAQEVLYHGTSLKLGGKWTWQSKTYDQVFGKAKKPSLPDTTTMLIGLTEVVSLAKRETGDTTVLIAAKLASLAQRLAA